ncbi:MAG: 50S ribosomal protein L10 [Rickettsiales bacterium]
MLKSQKYEFVEKLNSDLKEASTVIVTHYHGLSVSEVTKLRREMHKQSAKFIVTKNRLAKIAIKDTNFSALEEHFTGPTAIAISEDPVSAAKVVVDFAKENENLKIIGGVANDSAVNVSQIKALASLPSIDELRAKLVALIQTPATNLARMASAPASKVARVVSAYSTKS